VFSQKSSQTQLTSTNVNPPKLPLFDFQGIKLIKINNESANEPKLIEKLTKEFDELEALVADSPEEAQHITPPVPIYKTGLNCLGQPLYVYMYENLVGKSSTSDKIESLAADYTGVLGTQLDLLNFSSNGESVKVFTGNLIDFYGFDAKDSQKDCPPFMPSIKDLDRKEIVVAWFKFNQTTKHYHKASVVK
jgi:hypothetical protein